MQEADETPIVHLRKAVIAQKSAALPEPPRDPILQPLYDLLYDYDQYVAQTVIRVLQKNGKAQDYPQRALIDKGLGELGGPLSPVAKRDLELYGNYLERLDRMISLAKAVFSA